MNKKKEQRSKNKILQLQGKTHKLQVRSLTSPLDKLQGLIGQKEISSIYFTTRFGVHTFGMKFPIDVFILDSKNKIVRIKKSMKPNRLFFWSPKYYKVVETFSGVIQAKILDQVAFT